MDITQNTFRQEEIDQLRDYRDKQRDGRLKIRFVGLLMLAEDLAIELVACLIGRSVKTLLHWGDQYLTQGIACLNSFNYKPKQTYLKPPQIEQLVAWVKETAPAKTKQVRAYIKEQFKVTYTVEAVRQILHKQGLKRLRPKEVPGKAPSEEEQRAFVAAWVAHSARLPETTFSISI